MEHPHQSSSRRRTSRLVRLNNRCAEVVITTGGLGVLAAMLGICVFLVVVAAPLFRSGSVSTPDRVDVVLESHVSLLAAVSSDHQLYVLVEPTGQASVIEIETGRVLTRSPLFEPAAEITSSYYENGTGWVFLGHHDGSVSTGQFSITDEILPERALPDSLLELEPGSRRPVDETDAQELNSSGLLRTRATRASVFQRLESGGKLTTIEMPVSAPVVLNLGTGPVVRVSGTAANEREQFIVGAQENGQITLGRIRVKRSLSGGAPRTRITQIPVSTEPGAVPDWVTVDADGLHVLAIRADGTVDHLTRESNRAKVFELAETVAVVEPGQSINAAGPSLGARSLIVGDSAGRLTTWTLAPPQHSTDSIQKSDSRLAMASRTPPGAAITSFTTSMRDRSILAVDDSGSVSLFNMTSLRRIVRFTGSDSRPSQLALGPELDYVAVLSEDHTLTTWHLDPAYPEIGWRSLVLPIQFEGYSKPKHVYQSTGSPGAESKMSLVPLIWGTLKATVISMLIAVPLAVLSAIYTSEFLNPKLRRKIKPVIELMASLPSVVLGFIAAMLIAPFLRDHLSQVLLALFVLPVSLILGSTLLKFVPTRTARRISSGTQLSLIAITLSVATLAAVVFGGPIERALFHNPEVELAPGSPTGFIPWLNGSFGNPTPGWLLATVPVAVVVLFIAWSRFFGRRWGEWVSTRTNTLAAASELARVLVMLAAALLLGAGLAAALSAMGIDARDSIFGSYSQRNTLVVGLVMGFAVIPIIYTISEDALQAVPSGLRSASLGAGATRWQTAVRVVLPVAGSGIFSACMIGLGRAVGETMIVLMATGNTPEITTNIFSGFRTLAANIAVELPEAPRGGTHYRVLFLCGLVLFFMTLTINTIAEIVRQRVRRKNAGL